MSMRTMRELIRLVENATPKGGGYYAHVTAGNNLQNILQNGLLANVGGGNYSGYHESLSGVYVTKIPSILREHIQARDMQNDFLIILVHVTGESFLDEDAINDWLNVASNRVFSAKGMSAYDAVDEYDPDDPVWKQIVPKFRKNLGKPDLKILKKHPDIVEEYVDSWVREVVYGEDGDPTWWAGAKEVLVKAFPELRHPDHGMAYSLRIPENIEFEGHTKIIAIIHVKNKQPRLIKGTIPPELESFVSSIISP